ncbi:hypothetical protein ACX27_14730 [Nostoc piscinale CENA21]|uniref:Glycine zipper domain-containing protein n=2 Tax=Nostoc TaxID=1177 RepID=A0A0M5MHH8_9NOSO|nr:hypothetical protein ACX27_14730 [Nostoc piscinale CENA21]
MRLASGQPAGQAAFGAVGNFAGAAAGTAIGAAFGPVGMFVGGMIGGYVGGAIADQIWNHAFPPPATVAPQPFQAPPPFTGGQSAVPYIVHYSAIPGDIYTQNRTSSVLGPVESVELVRMNGLPYVQIGCHGTTEFETPTPGIYYVFDGPLGSSEILTLSKRLRRKTRRATRHRRKYPLIHTSTATGKQTLYNSQRWRLRPTPRLPWCWHKSRPIKLCRTRHSTRWHTKR